MSDKDYFGDDWADDSGDDEGSQIEYSEELLDESFGGDFEGSSTEEDSPILDSDFEPSLGSKSRTISPPIFANSGEPKLTQNGLPDDEKNEEDLVPVNASKSGLPQRPQIGVSEPIETNDIVADLPSKEDSDLAKTVAPMIEDSNQETVFDKDGLSDSSDNTIPKFSDTERAEEYFEAEPEGKAAAGSVLPVITSLPTVPPARTPKRPIREEVREVSDKVKNNIPKSDLLNKISEVDIDYDPDEEDSNDGDLPLITSQNAEEDESDYDAKEFDSEADEDREESEEVDSSLNKVKKERVQRTPDSKRKRPGPKRKRGPKPGIRLTARDVYLLMFLARYRVATIAQLARMFGTSETALRNRLPKLEKEKLVSWAWGAQSKPKLWLITKKGLQVTNMTLTVPTVKWGQLRHTLGLVDLGIEFELAGEVAITEREIRAAATRYTPTARIKTAVDFMHFVKEFEEEDENGTIKRALTIPMENRSFGHIPDMVLARQAYPNGASGNIAIELELNRKQTNEWVAVLTAYRDTELFELVQYYTMNKEIKRALTAMVKALGAEDKIQVHYFIPIDNTADPLITGGK